MSTGERRFDDAEVARVLERAAKLEATRGGSQGMTLAEIEDIAAKAGLDPALVRQAAQSVASSSESIEKTHPLVRFFFGAPFTLRYELELEGEITEGDHEAIAHALQTKLGEAGQMSAVGRTFSFHVMSQNRSLHVGVSSRNGRTIITAEEKLGNLAGGLFGGIGGGVGGGVTPLVAIGGAALFGPVAAVAASTLFFGAVWGATRAGYKGMVEKRDAKLRGVVEEIASTLGETVVRRDATTLEEARRSHGLSLESGSPIAVGIDVTENVSLDRRRR
jgi:hypothetical protein